MTSRTSTSHHCLLELLVLLQPTQSFEVVEVVEIWLQIVVCNEREKEQ